MDRPRSRAAALLALSIALLVAAVVLPPSGTAATRDVSAKISAPVLGATANGDVSSFLVILRSQADVSGAAFLGTKIAKGRYVYSTLRAHADRTQAPIKAMLDRMGATYRSHYLENLLVVSGNRALVDALAARSDVALIEPNLLVRSANLPAAPAVIAPATRAPDAIEWGVKKIRAPQVWMTGDGGQGIVLGNIDTGQQWDHPALKEHYRGWNGTSANHNYNWYDTIEGSPTPIDPNGHGTHTVGTMVGDDGGTNHIGVAPKAKYMTCRSMDEGGLGDPSTYITCLEFMLAPFNLQGQNPNPDLAPVSVSNSWYCGIPTECPSQGSLYTAVHNLRLGGILPVFSAGNNGPLCATVGIGGPPAQYDDSYSVGSSDMFDQLSSFSSRGPASVPGDTLIKPDIVAPGSSVRSSYPPSTYADHCGTSMASPHINSTIALILQAKPQLIGDPDGIESLINSTAWHRTSSDCSSNGSYPNNLYGYGLVNAEKAVKSG